MPRLFIALPVDDSVRSNLARATASVSRSHQASGGSASGRGVSWVAAENLHVTLAFLGEVEERRVTEVEDVVYAATEDDSAPLQLQARGLGAFPNESKARVLWAGLDGEVPRLIALQARLASELRRAGFEIDSKRFHPHITLARFRWPQPLPLPLPLPAGLAIGQEFGEWQAGEVHLIESRLHPTGARYIVRADVPLE